MILLAKAGHPIDNDRQRRWRRCLIRKRVHQEPLAVRRDVERKPVTAALDREEGAPVADIKGSTLAVDGRSHEPVVKREIEDLFAVVPPPDKVTAGGRDLPLAAWSWERRDSHFVSPGLIRDDLNLVSHGIRLVAQCQLAHVKRLCHQRRSAQEEHMALSEDDI